MPDRRFRSSLAQRMERFDFEFGYLRGSMPTIGHQLKIRWQKSRCIQHGRAFVQAHDWLGAIHIGISHRSQVQNDHEWQERSIFW